MSSLPAKTYTTVISKGAASLDETQVLLKAWTPGDDLQELGSRVQAEGLLAKSSAYRTRDVVNRIFAWRFLRPSDLPARMLKIMVEAGLSQRHLAEAVMIHTARRDDLLYDFISQVYWTASKDGRLILRVEDAVAFIGEGIERGYIAEPWSESVQVKIARGLLGALREFGLLEEHKRGVREIAPYRPSDIIVAYLAFDLHFAGVSDSSLVSHDDWGLYGLDRQMVLTRLEELGEKRLLTIQRAGSVVTITWPYQTMEDAVHAIIREFIR